MLEHLQAHLPDAPLHYWRDKAGREVDFVIVRSRDQVDAIECKWDPAQFDPAGLKAFRSWYPRGANYLVCPLTVPAYLKRFDELNVRVCDPLGIDIATRSSSSGTARRSSATNSASCQTTPRWIT